MSSWSVWTLTWILALRLFIALVSDPNRTENFSPLWFVIWLITAVQTLFIFWMARDLGLKRRLQRKPSIMANLVLGAIIGASANLTTGAFAIAWNLDHEGLWHIRAVGGAFSFPLMFIFLNNIRGAIVERNANIAQLREIEEKLLGYRESAKQILQDTYESMRARTTSAVSPALDHISLLLQNQATQNSRVEIIDELRTVISDEVRPLSRSLREAAEQLSVPAKGLAEQPKLNLAPRNKINLRQSLKLMPAMLVLIFSFPMVAFLVIDHRSMFRGILGAACVAAVIALLRLLVPKNKEFNGALGIFLQALFASIAVAPAFCFTYLEYGLTQQVVENGIWMVCISVSTFVLTSYARATDMSLQKFEADLETFNEQLSKEVALFEQKLWLERRAWSYVLHGDIQGALSAAVARMQRSEQLEPYEIEMVKQDLERAKAALKSEPTRDIDFTSGLNELVRAWAGVCDIKIESSARATRAIESNRDIRNCINEICKEAISNAVKHGNAKNAWIYFTRDQDDVINLEVCNDGHRLLRDQQSGMGLAMVEDLSLNWQLTSERHQGKTCLVAELPISNKNS